jgi:hypothetical protein
MPRSIKSSRALLFEFSSRPVKWRSSLLRQSTGRWSLHTSQPQPPSRSKYRIIDSQVARTRAEHSAPSIEGKRRPENISLTPPTSCKLASQPSSNPPSIGDTPDPSRDGGFNVQDCGEGFQRQCRALVLLAHYSPSGESRSHGFGQGPTNRRVWMASAVCLRENSYVYGVVRRSYEPCAHPASSVTLQASPNRETIRCGSLLGLGRNQSCAWD